MEPSDLIQITDIDTLTAKYTEILGDRVHTDGSHPLYNKGVFDGMAIILSALSESMRERKRLSMEPAG